MLWLSHFGKSTADLATPRIVPNPNWKSIHSEEQAFLLMATCAKLLQKWDIMNSCMQKMQLGQRSRSNFKVSNQTCTLLLLPLEKNRIEIEKAVTNFIELVLFQNKD